MDGPGTFSDLPIIFAIASFGELEFDLHPRPAFGI